MRPLLENIKSMVDEIYQKEPDYWQGAGEMVLYPGASESSIADFFKTSLGKKLPPSYTELLRASNGLDFCWDHLCFVGTDKVRRKPILANYRIACKELEESFLEFHDAVNDNTVAEWESNPRRLFPALHPVLAASGDLNLLLGDMKTRQADGEMELCRWSIAEDTTARYRDIQSYFEAIYKEVEKYHAKRIAKKRIK